MSNIRMIEVAIAVLCAIAVVCGALSLFWIADLALVFPALGPPVAALAIWRNRVLARARPRPDKAA
jgi:hypothetical protein